jgi:Mg-chelatase subunit ChlD
MFKTTHQKTLFLLAALVALPLGCSRDLGNGGGGAGAPGGTEIYEGPADQRGTGGLGGGSTDGADGTGSGNAESDNTGADGTGQDDPDASDGNTGPSGDPSADENSDGDGYCWDLEFGYYECDDGVVVGDDNPDQNDQQLVGGDDTGTGTPPNGGDSGDGGGDSGSGDPNDPNDPNNPGDPNDPNDPNDPGNPGPSEPECGLDAFNESTQLPPRILLVVDKSGSMDEGAVGYPGSKWQGVRGAITAVMTSLETDVEMGLMLFPDGSADANVCQSGRVFNPVATGQAANIIETLNANDPGGGTPTAPTLYQAEMALQAIGEEGGPRVVILATDGGPNCNAGLNENSCRCTNPNGCNDARNCLDDQNTIEAVEHLNAQGFSTFVVGIPGSENFTDVLQSLADAGGTSNGPQGFYEASDSNALATAIESIAARLANCRFELQGPAIYVDDMTVNLGNTTVPRDTTRQNGWDMVDTNTLEVFGTYCDALAADPNISLEVDYCFVPDFL